MRPPRLAADPRPTARPRPARLWPWVLFAMTLLLATLPRPRTEPLPAAPADVAPATASAATAAPVDADAAGRQLVAAPARTYADYVEQLVAIGLETSRLHGKGDRAGAEASDARARSVFATMLERLPDAECEALAALVGRAPPAADDVHGLLRRRVHRLVLGAGLQRRHAGALVAGGDRQPLDSLVTGALAALPASDALADEIGQGQLADRPYLGAAHERMVLDLVALSGEQRFPAAVAAALLTTLWRNLQAAGLRTSDELAGLALLLLQDGNESQRQSACRQLLLDDRYRLVVLQQLRASKDRALARDVAMIAAQELPPPQALEVLDTATAVGLDTPAPFLVLGQRDVGALQQAYEEHLADDVDPRLRDLLVAGAGFARQPRGIEVARLALASDPDPDVRLRAVFALTANAADALGEQAINSVLDDPRIRDDPQRLGAVVLALDNLVRARLVNAVDRLGQRLRGCPALTASARDDLERILARALPGGRTSR